MIATLVAAFLLPRMGKFVDKFGARIVLITTIILLGVGCLLFGAASNFLMLALGFGFFKVFWSRLSYALLVQHCNTMV